MLAVLVVGAGIVFADWWNCFPQGTKATYAGQGKCIQCHQPQHRRWHGSHHDQAMDLATPETVLANFDQQFNYHGIDSKFTREGDKFFVETDGPDGELQKYPVKYTFGVEPLQQYMVEMEKGRVQVLPFAWDTVNKRWFHIYQDDPRPIRHDDPLHWTRPGQNWNHVCADCHSTNLQKNYDNETDSFKTTWSEIDVSCEACHGPGSLHIEIAEKKWLFWDRHHGYGLAKLKGEDPTAQLETCARCHSHRSSIYPDYHAGRRLLDHYIPALLDGGLYHLDGQINQEVYVHGSFQQSRMFREGVRCTDCHDPHSTKIKFQGNKLCSQCHEPVKFDTPSHHHHKVGGTGSLCVECHMPAKKYMVVDARRDHSLRVPRPDLSLKLGTPNACTGCHLDPNKSGPWDDYPKRLEAAHGGNDEAKKELRELDRWSSERVRAWFGEKRRNPPHYALTLAAAIRGELEDGAPQKEDRREELNEIAARLVKLAKQRKDVGPIVRASAISRFGGYLSPSQMTNIEAANKTALKDGDASVRLAATHNLMVFYGASTSDIWNFGKLNRQERQTIVARSFVPLREFALPLLEDPVRAVRFEAARALATVPKEFFQTEEQQRIRHVLSELKLGYLDSGDRAPAQLMLAQLYASHRRLEDAEQAYRTALSRQDSYIPARTGLADLYLYQEKYAEAEKLLRGALEFAKEIVSDPRGEEQQAELHYRLGLLLRAANKPLLQTVKELAKAIALDPKHAQARFVYATAQRDLDDWDAAERHYRLVYERVPTSKQYLDGLVSLYKQRIERYINQRPPRWSKALFYAKKSVKLMPGNAAFQRKLREIQRELR